MDKQTEQKDYLKYGPVSEDETILVDESGTVHFMNESVRKQFGFGDTEISLMKVDQILPDISLKELEQGALIQKYGKHKSGSTFPLFMRMNSFMLQGEKYFLLVFHNVKDRTKLPRELSEPLNELVDLKYALDESTIVAIADHKGKIKYVNEKFCEVSQYSAEELIGKDHRIINSGYHSKEFMMDLWQTISKGEVWRGEIKNLAKDGTYYWVDTTIVPFLDEHGKPYQHLAIRKEVTEYKRIVEELKNSVQELMDLKFALDESSIVAITNEKGIITYVNDQFCQVSKYSKDELIGQDHEIVNSGYHPKEFFKTMWQTIGTGKVWKGEVRNRAKDGTIYWVDTTIVPFLNEKGKPYQYLAIRYEITERKQVEEELQKTMTRIIDVQEDERKRLSRNLHDGIGQNLYSHLITINRLTTEMDHPLLTQMQQEATQLIEEVREISWELRPSVLDDLGLVPAIRSFLTRFSDHYNIDVYFECVLNERLGFTTETTIYRIIQESLTNIRKYAGVYKATVTVRETDEVIRVMIEDHGTGFEINNTSRGVGLFSMEERARSVGGELHINSVPEKGTRVILEVPK